MREKEERKRERARARRERNDCYASVPARSMLDANNNHAPIEVDLVGIYE